MTVLTDVCTLGPYVLDITILDPAVFADSDFVTLFFENNHATLKFPKFRYLFTLACLTTDCPYPGEYGGEPADLMVSVEFQQKIKGKWSAYANAGFNYTKRKLVSFYPLREDCRRDPSFEALLMWKEYLINYASTHMDDLNIVEFASHLIDGGCGSKCPPNSPGGWFMYLHSDESYTFIMPPLSCSTTPPISEKTLAATIVANLYGGGKVSSIAIILAELLALGTAVVHDLKTFNVDQLDLIYCECPPGTRCVPLIGCVPENEEDPIPPDPINPNGPNVPPPAITVGIPTPRLPGTQPPTLIRPLVPPVPEVTWIPGENVYRIRDVPFKVVRNPAADEDDFGVISYQYEATELPTMVVPGTVTLLPKVNDAVYCRKFLIYAFVDAPVTWEYGHLGVDWNPYSSGGNWVEDVPRPGTVVKAGFFHTQRRFSPGNPSNYMNCSNYHMEPGFGVYHREYILPMDKQMTLVPTPMYNYSGGFFTETRVYVNGIDTNGIVNSKRHYTIHNGCPGPLDPPVEPVTVAVLKDIVLCSSNAISSPEHDVGTWNVKFLRRTCLSEDKQTVDSLIQALNSREFLASANGLFEITLVGVRGTPPVFSHPVTSEIFCDTANDGGIFAETQGISSRVYMTVPGIRSAVQVYSTVFTPR